MTRYFKPLIIFFSVLNRVSSVTEKLNIKVQALWDFDGNGGGLSFNAGDILTVTSKEMGDWWEAELDGVSGIIPATFVEEI